ncbi:hypothetical protein BDV59DRAFT_197789 [Aspergillus ambiguus]|uniref:uncharacterized protein n=1 Tax=Aspergillus ambiguus TaxID=176160 RepID=UPI003CCDDE98
MALVRDPAFWRRFSRAIHLDEEAKAQLSSSETLLFSDEWIKAERRKKKRHVVCCVMLAIGILVTVVAVVIVLWWFGTHNWGRETKPSEEALKPTKE